MRHRLLLRPRVAGRIVSRPEAGRLEARQQSLRGVELAVDRRPQQLSGCLRKRREPDPLPLRRPRRVAGSARRNRGLSAEARSVEAHHQPLPGRGRHQSQAGSHKFSSAHAAHSLSRLLSDPPAEAATSALSLRYWSTLALRARRLGALAFVTAGRRLSAIGSAAGILKKPAWIRSAISPRTIC